MSDLPFCPPSERLQQLLASPAGCSAGEQEQLIAHLDQCTVCQRTLETLAGANPVLLAAAQTLRRPLYVEEPPLRRVLDRLGNDADLTILYSKHSQVDRPLPRAEEAQKALRQLEGYEVLELLGQGGMALVFQALDRGLKRPVAIKVLAPDLACDPIARQRFAREAQAAAALRHDHVITIHSVSEINGLPFLVMEYIEGGSLQDYLDLNGPADWQVAARLGAQVARGLAAAHALGLVHRDIKPSNILLAGGRNEEAGGRKPSGESNAPDGLRPPASAPSPATWIPKISDFGLVCVADEVRLTQTGIITGTPMYMAPEQALCEPFDGRADLFSLGSVLYALCTGREPFATGSALAVLRQVCEVTPRPIREINPNVPTWLAALVERLHAKRPTERFAAAAEVAELLEYNLDHPDQPRTVPQPRAVADRFRSRRRRIVAPALLAVCLVLGTLLLGELMHWTRWTGLSGSGKAQEHGLPLLACLEGHQGPVWSVAFSPDGKTLATGGDDATLRLWDAATGKEKASLPGHGHAIFSVVFAHSGKFLISGDGTGALRQWNAGTWTEEPPLPPHTGNSRRLAISPDDRTLAIGSGQSVELWDLVHRKVGQTLAGHQGTVMGVAFSPDGKRLATGDALGRILLWDLATGSSLADFRGDSLGLRALAFTPDNRKLASAGTGDKDVKIWDVALPEASDPNRPPEPVRLATLSVSENPVWNMAISPGGRLLATAARDGTVMLWDIASATPHALVTLQAHRGSVGSVAFSPDGRTLATVGEDRLGKVWDLGKLADS